MNDLEVESSFYSSVIGLVETHRVTGGEGDGTYAESVMRSPDSDGPSLLLIKHLHREAPTPGEAVLGFSVADVDELVRAAQAAGGTVRGEPRSIPRYRMRTAQVTDPEGHLLEFVQHL
ncbi:VOC family protein [Streptomyces olindensis]|uniref:VOC family protein n=1 Tax=Streptomyces olindensis TaxID=358823 RepID=UPI0033C553AE